MSTMSVRSMADHIEIAYQRNIFSINQMVRQYARNIVKALDEWERRGLDCDVLVLMGSRGMYQGARAQAVPLARALEGLPARHTERLSRPLPSPQHVRVFAALPEGFCGVVFVEPGLLDAARAELASYKTTTELAAE